MSAAVRALGRLAGCVPRSALPHVYRVGPLARGVRRLLNSCLGDGTAELQVPAGPLARARLVLDVGHEKSLWLGTYEPWVHDALVARLRPGMTAWDVGAELGYHTLLMERLVRPGRVVALEPDPANRARLERHVALNAAGGVEILPLAAGAAAGRGRVQRNLDNPGATRIVFGPLGAAGGRRCQAGCEVVTLDALLQRHPAPQLVKVDVEGAEADVLEGAVSLVEAVRPVWVLETHGEPGERAAARLRAAGYSVRPIGKGVGVPADHPAGGPAHVIATP